MFKATLKLLLLTLLLTAGFVFVSGGQASALTDNCPWAPGPNWGNGGEGEGSGLMASLMVHAVDTSNGNPLNVNYTLNSDLENNSNPDLDKRIFKWPIGTGRDNQHTFATGEHLGNGSGGYNCNGWSVLGPGTADHIGNGWVLDCGGGGQGIGSSEFWISHVENPGGASGRWKLINETDGRVLSNDVNTDGGRVIKIHVINGGNVRLRLEWHPNTPPPPPSQGKCNYIDIYNEGTYTNAGGNHPTRAHVQVSGVTGVSVNGGGADWSQHGIDGYAPDANGDFAYRDKTWGYTAEQPTVNITVTKESYFGTGANLGWHTISGGWSVSITCISVSCNINSVVDAIPRPNNIIVAGDQVYVNGTIYNNSPPDGPILNLYLSGTGGNSSATGPIGPNGGNAPVSLATTAPGPPQNWTVSYSVAGASASSSCSKTVPVYQYFNISPHASITNTNAEDPATVNYTTGGTLTQGPTVTAGTQSWLTKQKSGVPPPPPTVDSHFTVDNYGSVDHSYSYNNTSIEAGDQYCAHVTINPANGYRAPPGYGDVGDQPATADSGCLTVVNEPYTHFFGADVMAGGGFGNSCTTSPGTINAFINDTGTKPKGSGSQFGAQALGVIEGFASANLRGSAPLGASGLSFSNRSDFVSGTAPGSPNLGGRLGLSSFCVPDYYGAKPSSPSTPTSTNNAPVGASGVQYYKPPSGTLHIGSGSIGNGVSETIYVDGNVYINGSGITYAGAGGWSSVTQIPSFSIIAKGNIYIDPSVKQLDGVYVAQPLSSGTKGIINTCSSGAGSYTIAQIYNSCKNQLVINGAFVAQQVFLDRSYSSLRYGQNGEHDLGGFGSHTCGTAGEAVPAGGPISGSDCAAEIFNFSPEVYLSHPASTPVSGPTTGKYDDITSLSPVL